MTARICEASQRLFPCRNPSGVTNPPMPPLTTIIGLPVLAAVVLAACGGGSHRAGSSSGHENKQVALAQCMRAHGVTSFPDPTQRAGGGVGLSITAVPGSSTLTVDGTTFAGPTFTSAEKSCKLFGGGSSPPPISEKQKQQLVSFARCMRAHGVRGWADPTFPAGGGVEDGGTSNPAERSSPATQKAVKTCNRLVGL